MQMQKRRVLKIWIDMQMKIKYNIPKPRNLVAKDLRTPKYRMRAEESKVRYIRQPKHRKDTYANEGI